MTRLNACVVATLASCAVIGATVIAQTPGTGAKAEIDKKIRPLTLPLVKDLRTGEAKEGVKVALSELKEKVLVLYGVSEPCSVSWRYEKRMGDLLKKYAKNKDVAIYGLRVSANDTDKSLCKYYENKNIPVPLLDDPTGEAQRLFGIRATPTFMVLDRDKDGARVLRYSGSFDDNPDAARVSNAYVPLAIEALLAGKEITVKETRPFG